MLRITARPADKKSGHAWQAAVDKKRVAHGRTPDEAVIALLRSLADAFERQGSVPPWFYRQIDGRLRVVSIGLTTDTSLSRFGALLPAEPPPVEIAVERRDGAEGFHYGRYRYTAERWAAVEAAWKKTRTAHPVPDGGLEDITEWATQQDT